ncbi:MAG: hypothetical protein ACE5H4_15165 [Candidatus Thorarchaeota archaeon]
MPDETLKLIMAILPSIDYWFGGDATVVSRDAYSDDSIEIECEE